MRKDFGIPLFDIKSVWEITKEWWDVLIASYNEAVRKSDPKYDEFLKREKSTVRYMTVH